MQAAPGSGVCGPCTYLVKNCATRGSSALSTVTCLPQALSISAPSCFSTGLISEYGVDLTRSVSLSTSAGSASPLWVTQTAPCSSEWTALTSGIAFS